MKLGYLLNFYIIEVYSTDEVVFNLKASVSSHLRFFFSRTLGKF